MIPREDGKRRVIAWIADTHTMSAYGLASPGFKTVEGNELGLNEPQKKLYGSYLRFIEICDYQKVDTICIVGDLIHGQNIVEAGMGLMTTNLDDQVLATVELLKPIVKGRRVYFWQGSGYHRSTKGHNPELDVCNHEALVKEAVSTQWMGPIANVQFSPSEKTFNVQHGVTKAYIYVAMLMEREINELLVAEQLKQIPDIDVIVHAHSHKFRHLHVSQKHMILLPCWCMYIPWKGSLMSYGKFQPDIGGVITVIDEEDRIQVWHYLYNVPRVVGDIIEG